MTKLSDIMPSNVNGEIYPECEFVGVDELVDSEIGIIDVKPFSNFKGDGVAFKFYFIADPEKTALKCITHAKILTSVLTGEGVSSTIYKGDTIECTIKQITSKKTGMKMYVVQ